MVDLALTDQRYMDIYHDPYIQVGGTFAGVAVRPQLVKVEDNIKIEASFGAVRPSQAALAVEEWRDVMVSRMQAVLDLARYEGQNLGIGPGEYRSI